MDQQNTDSQVVKDTSRTTKIGATFLMKYYTIMNNAPQTLFHFYKDESVFTHGYEDGVQQTVFGQKNIHEKITSLGYKDCKVSLSVVDCQQSLGDGVLVVAFGHISNKGEAPRKFIQTFFLAVQTDPAGYYVLNDVFRHLKDSPAEQLANLPQSIISEQTNAIPTTQVVQQEPKPPAVPQAIPEPAPQPTTNFASQKSTETKTVEPKEKEKEVRLPTNSGNEQSHPPKTTEPKKDNRSRQKPKNSQEKSDSTNSTSNVDNVTNHSSNANNNSQSITENKENSRSNDNYKERPYKNKAKASKEIKDNKVEKTSAPKVSSPSWADVVQHEFDSTEIKEPLKPIKPEAKQPTPAVKPEVTSNSEPTATSSPPTNPTDNSLEPRGVYLSNLPFTVTDEEVISIFSKLGKIKHFNLKSQKGYGFIEFDSSEVAQKIIKDSKIKPIIIDGRTLTVEERKTKNSNSNRRKDKDYSNKPRNFNGNNYQRSPTTSKLEKQQKPFYRNNNTDTVSTPNNSEKLQQPAADNSKQKGKNSTQRQN